MIQIILEKSGNKNSFRRQDERNLPRTIRDLMHTHRTILAAGITQHVKYIRTPHTYHIYT